MMFKIAFRNIFRNARRSIMTILAIAIGAAAMLVFGAYSQYDLYVLQTSTVARTGHLQVYRKGFFDFGSGNPAIWGMDDYKNVLRLIKTDPVLAPMIAVATPVQFLTGIAGNPVNDESKTFFATGFIPSDLARMKLWDEYGARGDSASAEDLADNDPTLGVIGIGFARILGLCAPLHVSGCPKLPVGKPAQTSAADLSTLPRQDFSALSTADAPTTPAQAGPPTINLLSSTAGGAPNIVNLKIRHVEYQAAREMDDNYIAMHLAQAQQLVYGRGEHKVSAIILQLHRTEDIPAGRARLADLFAQHRLDLDAHDFFEINSFYGQAEGFFSAVFSFIAVIMGVVVLFTVSNAMSMSVVERTDEIGTTRALGVRRSGIRTQFLLEGGMLGILGATLGVTLAFAATMAVNNSGLTWTPPGDSHPIALKLYLTGATQLIVTVWLVLTGVATIAAFLPANRAARLAVVDALRHV
ncbi:MAG TPA: FtsX-like permease family protein [Rhizomicrobium sp.]